MVSSALRTHAKTVTFLVLLLGFYTLLFTVERSLWLGTPTANMQQIKFNYSLKNIGLPPHDNYRRNIIEKTHSVIQRMRWRAHFYLQDTSNITQPKTYGLKSKRSAPTVAELKPFEDDVAKMIENITFRNVNNEFIQSLENDKRKIKSSTNVLIFADKTRNIYEMNAPTYHKLLTENVTKTYKHAQDSTMTEINRELKDIASDLKIANRIDPMQETPAFISLKDHKPDFDNHPKCRLINPAKSELGKVSKVILDDINSQIREQTHANQWRNTTDAISWFQSIPNKHRQSFISFDIVDFYPTITETLLDRAITWAQHFVTITDKDIKIIKHARKSLLFHQDKIWSKRSSETTFDVTMGCYDGAEICELVGLFILQALKQRFGDNIGLYRDDGLATINTKSGRLCDKARKDLTDIFNDFELKITVQTNQLRTNFLDVTFDLTDGTYKPYRKPNNEPLYINRSSNHPPSIIRQLPQAINRRINTLSCNKEVFDTAAPQYNDALRKSDFNTNITYQPPDTNTNSRRNRQHNVIWYNPPYSKNVKTNIAHDFLLLIDKHFPPSNKLNRLFNRHTVRVSYSCTENMKSFINRHNKAVLKNHTNQPQTNNNTDHRQCNCRHPEECPIEGKCLQKNVVYKADVTTTDNNETRTYIGVTANAFKTRHRNHTKSFRNKQYSNETELSKHIWKLKENQRIFNIKWSIIKQIPTYKTGPKKCRLCLEEKLLIMKGRRKNILNKRSELFTACRHVT